jgi:hypothetical protein
MGRAVNRSAVYLLTLKIRSARSHHDSGRFVSWARGVPSLPLSMAHKCVSLSPTLSPESTGCLAIEGLWGTFDLWTDRLRGKTRW